MTLKQLETFYWVCRLGGFAAAARHMHSTQSGVSMRIQDLESSLGVAVARFLEFTRGAMGHTVITANGAIAVK